MKTYSTYKNEIEGFGDVLETFKVVEKIAASSIHFLSESVSNLDEYSDNLNMILSRLSVFDGLKKNILLTKRVSGKKLLVIITGDKGLVGGLWHNIINLFLEKKNEYDSVIIIGDRGKKYLEEEGIETIKAFSQFEISDINIITDYVFNQFKKEKFSSIDILYPKFISLAEQTSSFTSFLPFTFKKENNPIESMGFPIFENSKDEIFDELLKKYVGIYFYKIFLESKLSEFSARTVSMEYAAIKTKKFIKKSKRSFEKERRKFITQLQIESFITHKI